MAALALPPPPRFLLALILFTLPHIAAALLLPCPTTRWSVGLDAPETPPEKRAFLRTIDRPKEPCPILPDDELRWLSDHARDVLRDVDRHGVVHLRGFDLPRTPSGLRRFTDALAPLLRPCDDPLSSIGVRSLLSKGRNDASGDDGVFEAVDDPSLSSTFIGLHNDATYALAAPYAAFACFRRADVGGEFLVADGRAVLRDLDEEVINTLHRRLLRVRVASFPIGSVIPTGVGLRAAAAALLRFGLGLATPLGLDVEWSSAEGNSLQILERPKSAFNRHPITGEPTFFSGVHSQSRYLQQKRSGDSFEGVAMTDVFSGDMMCIEPDVLDHIDEAITKNTFRIQMSPGDVVLLDSYSVLHGRETFKGPRQHGVIWLTSDFYDTNCTGERGGGSALSKLVNKLAVKGRDPHSS